MSVCLADSAGTAGPAEAMCAIGCPSHRLLQLVADDREQDLPDQRRKNRRRSPFPGTDQMTGDCSPGDRACSGLSPIAEAKPRMISTGWTRSQILSLRSE